MLLFAQNHIRCLLESYNDRIHNFELAKVGPCNIVHTFAFYKLKNVKRGPRGFGLTVNGCTIKALLAIGHRFKSPMGS